MIPYGKLFDRSFLTPAHDERLNDISDDSTNKSKRTDDQIFMGGYRVICCRTFAILHI
ncbi:hypothetical protein J5TS2_08210 [Brevibacillus halotolerans]|nr:hypothetical protein J5TS2_08210 [Brevibacillus halotolerans]